MSVVRNQRTDEEHISRLLTFVLRHSDFKSDDFVALSSIKRQKLRGARRLNKYTEAQVREAVVKSVSRKSGARFDVRDDPIHGFSIKVCSPFGRRRRGSVQQHLETPNAASSFDEVWITEESEEDEGDEGHIDDDPRKLRDFLAVAFSWFSGHVEVPNTKRLKYFIAHWDDVVKQPACVSMDLDRRKCLDCILNLWMSLEMVLQKGEYVFRDVDQCEGWIYAGDRRWYNWNLTKFLATWELWKYKSSWRMSWRQVHLLFQEAVHK